MIFACPACGIKLTVPVSLVGVSGPCPSCRARIQSPSSSALSASGMAEPPLDPPQAAIHEETASIAPNAPLQPPSPSPEPATVLQPDSLQEANQSLQEANQSRQEANQSLPAQLAVQQMPELPQASELWNIEPNPLPLPPPERNPAVRFLITLLFLIASGALVYFILTILKM